jgi:hypothetical protein
LYDDVIATLPAAPGGDLLSLASPFKRQLIQFGAVPRSIRLPLAVALRSMLAETEAKIATAEPAEKSRLQQRAEVRREWIAPKARMPLSA